MIVLKTGEVVEINPMEKIEEGTLVVHRTQVDCECGNKNCQNKEDEFNLGIVLRTGFKTEDIKDLGEILYKDRIKFSDGEVKVIDSKRENIIAVALKESYKKEIKNRLEKAEKEMATEDEIEKILKRILSEINIEQNITDTINLREEEVTMRSILEEVIRGDKYQIEEITFKGGTKVNSETLGIEKEQILNGPEDSKTLTKENIFLDMGESSFSITNNITKVTTVYEINQIESIATKNI